MLYRTTGMHVYENICECHDRGAIALPALFQNGPPSTEANDAVQWVAIDEVPDGLVIRGRTPIAGPRMASTNQKARKMNDRWEVGVLSFLPPYYNYSPCRGVT